MLRRNVASQVITFCLVNATTGAALTGATVTTKVALDGTQSAGSGTVTELGTGQYKYVPTQGETNGNSVGFGFTATNAVPVNLHCFTASFDPTNATTLGLTNLDAAVSSRSTYAGGAVASVTAGVTLADGVTHGGATALLSLQSVTVSNSAGSAVTLSSTGANGHGLDLAGNGTGRGLTSTGGATGEGGRFAGGATSGASLRLFSTNGIGLHVNAGVDASALALVGAGSGAGVSASGGTTGNGAQCFGGATSGNGIVGSAAGVGAGWYGSSVDGHGAQLVGGTNGHGMSLAGSGSGEGLSAQGGATGHGIQGQGGATSGNGITSISQASGHGIEAQGAGGGDGMRVLGQGAGEGLRATGGATGNGIEAAGGATSGSGIAAIGQTSGHGLSLAGAGTGYGLRAAGGATGGGIQAIGGATSGDGILCTVTSGFEINADINGTITTATNVTTVNGLAAGVITAAAAAADFGEEIADFVWDEVLTGAAHNVASSAGKRLRQLTNAASAFDGTLAGTPTTTVCQLDATASTTTDFYKPGLLVVESSFGIQFRRIDSYNGATREVTVASAFTTTPVFGDVATIIPWASVRVSEFDAGVITAAAIATDAIDADALAADATAEIADKLLGRSIAGAADGGRTVKDALKANRNKVAISAGTMTVYEADDVTPAWTAAVTTAAGNPIDSIDPA